MSRSHWDLLIYHDKSEHSERLVTEFKEFVQGLEEDIGEEVKVASTAEYFNTGCRFASMDDALYRYGSWFTIIYDVQLLTLKFSAFQLALEIIANNNK